MPATLQSCKHCADDSLECCYELIIESIRAYPDNAELLIAAFGPLQSIDREHRSSQPANSIARVDCVSAQVSVQRPPDVLAASS